MILAATRAAGTQPAVDLTVTAIPAGTVRMTIRRSYLGESSVVRDANSAATNGALTLVYSDFETPFGVAVTYTAFASSASGAQLGTAQSAPVTITSDVPWISDPLSPGVATAVVLINESLQEIGHDAPGQVVQIAESGLPVALMGVPGEASSVPLRFKAATSVNGFAIRQVLRQANPLLLRVPPVYGAHVPNIDGLAYIAFTGWQDVKVSGEHDQIVLSGGVQVAAPSSPVVAPPRTYGDVRNEANSYGDLTTMYDNYLELLRG